MLASGAVLTVAIAAELALESLCALVYKRVFILALAASSDLAISITTSMTKLITLSTSNSMGISIILSMGTAGTGQRFFEVLALLCPFEYK